MPEMRGSDRGEATNPSLLLQGHLKLARSASASQPTRSAGALTAGLGQRRKPAALPRPALPENRPPRSNWLYDGGKSRRLL